jgi:hypothetical protein
MCASRAGSARAIFSARGVGPSQEAVDGNINVQSACALNTVYNTYIQVTCCIYERVQENEAVRSR